MYEEPQRPNRVGKPENGLSENGKPENGLSENGKPVTTKNKETKNKETKNKEEENSPSPISFFETKQAIIKRFKYKKKDGTTDTTTKGKRIPTSSEHQSITRGM